MQLENTGTVEVRPASMRKKTEEQVQERARSLAGFRGKCWICGKRGYKERKCGSGQAVERHFATMRVGRRSDGANDAGSENTVAALSSTSQRRTRCTRAAYQESGMAEGEKNCWLGCW